MATAVSTAQDHGSHNPVERLQSMTMSNPLPISFGIFAFVFIVYGVRFVGVTTSTLTGPTTDALNFAILIAGIAEFIGALLALFRGTTHSSWASGIFGIWLIGFYFLLTHTTPDGAATWTGIMHTVGGKAIPAATAAVLAQTNVQSWHADSVAWYVLPLLVPVAILAIHPIMHRDLPLSVVFIAIVVILALLGLSFHDVYSTLNNVVTGKAAAPALNGPVNLLRISAWAAFVAAVASFWLFYRMMRDEEANVTA